MAPGPQFAHNPAMDEDTLNALFAQATELAYRSFDYPSDDHIEAIYRRLLVNHQWGAGDDGAVTVH